MYNGEKFSPAKFDVRTNAICLKLGKLTTQSEIFLPEKFNTEFYFEWLENSEISGQVGTSDNIEISNFECKSMVTWQNFRFPPFVIRST